MAKRESLRSIVRDRLLSGEMVCPSDFHEFTADQVRNAIEAIRSKKYSGNNDPVPVVKVGDNCYQRQK